jgi:hypothetical protein
MTLLSSMLSMFEILFGCQKRQSGNLFCADSGSGPAPYRTCRCRKRDRTWGLGAEII